MPRIVPSRATALTVLLVLVTGCFGGGESPAPQVPDLYADLAQLAQCDVTRPAVAHRSGGVPVEEPPFLAPVPCMSKTGVNSREPTMGVAADGTIFHYPAMTGDNTAPMGVSVSRDNGTTWEVVLPSLAGQPTHTFSLDPYFWLDATTGRIFADDIYTVNCSIFSWSDDNGATWEHSYSGCLETDHQTIFTGVPTVSQTTGYPNVVYRCAINAVALSGSSTMATCQRSLDGGRTWLAPGQPAYVTPPERGTDVCSGAHGHGVTDRQGRVYLPKAHCEQPWLAMSDDEGQTWTRSLVHESGTNPQGHDTAVDVDAAGNVYYWWIGEDRLAYLAVSRDRGATWSEPFMIAAPGVNEVSQPALIAGGLGKVALVYMGTTNGPGAPFDGSYANTTWNAYVTVSWNALDANPLFWSAPVNDPEADPFVVGTCDATRCQGVQDFLDVVVGPDGTPWGAFVDDCLGEGAQCLQVDAALDTTRVGAVGWLLGGPSLWDEDDPNGPYP